MRSTPTSKTKVNHAMASSVLRSSIFGIAALVAFTFVPAGTLAYWQGWAYVTTWIVVGAMYTLYVAHHDPALLKRRTEAGISYEQEPAQKVVIACWFAAFVALMVMPPLDHRFGWSRVPWYVSVLGDASIAVSFYIFYLVGAVNTYAAANVRVEEGQTVVSTGLYGVVRHPMYFGALFLLVGTPLALGSWWALVLVPLFLPILYFRITNEEEVLTRDLPGYKEYMQKVRHRLIPGIY